MITEEPEVIAERETVHERIQAQIQHEDKEAEVAEEVMLDIPLEWHAVPDLVMEDEEKLIIMTRGCRKWPKEDDIHPEKCEHTPKVSRRACNPEGFYSKDWDGSKKEEDEWQIPDKWQRISQMVFLGGCPEINPEVIGDISRSCTQHQGGRCRVSVAQRI